MLVCQPGYATYQNWLDKAAYSFKYLHWNWLKDIFKAFKLRLSQWPECKRWSLCNIHHRQRRPFQPCLRSQIFLQDQSTFWTQSWCSDCSCCEHTTSHSDAVHDDTCKPNGPINKWAPYKFPKLPGLQGEGGKDMWPSFDLMYLLELHLNAMDTLLHCKSPDQIWTCSWGTAMIILMHHVHKSRSIMIHRSPNCQHTGTDNEIALALAWLPTYFSA